MSIYHRITATHPLLSLSHTQTHTPNANNASFSHISSYACGMPILKFSPLPHWAKNHHDPILKSGAQHEAPSVTGQVCKDF